MRSQKPYRPMSAQEIADSMQPGEVKYCVPRRMEEYIVAGLIPADRGANYWEKPVERFAVLVDGRQTGLVGNRDDAIRLWDNFRSANPDRTVSLTTMP